MIIGRIKGKFVDKYADLTTNQVRLRFLGAFLITSLQIDAAGDYGFFIKAELSFSTYKVLGQIIILVTPKSGSIPLGIGNLNTDNLPYSPFSSTVGPKISIVIHPKVKDNATFRFYFIFTFACIMIFPILYVFVGGYYLRRQVALEAYRLQERDALHSPRSTSSDLPASRLVMDILDQEGELL